MTCVPLQLLQKELRELEGGDAGEGGGEGGAPSGVDALAVRAARGQHVSEPVAPSRTAWSPQAALQALPLPAEVRRAVDKEVKKLRRLNPSMPDHAVTQTCGAVGHTALATRARAHKHTHTPRLHARGTGPRADISKSFRSCRGGSRQSIRRTLTQRRYAGRRMHYGAFGWDNDAVC